MEVILLERVEKLGQMGDVVTVKPGFARNFLLPRNKALRATEHNKKRFEADKAQLEAESLKRKEEAEAVAKKMGELTVILIRQAGEGGQLYGSVNARDIAAGVTEAGFTLGRSQVELSDPIKTLGLFDIKVVLHPEVVVTVTANVARSKDEAETQAATGRAVVGLDEAPIEAEPAPAVEEVFEEEIVDEVAEELGTDTAESPEEEPKA